MATQFWSWIFIQILLVQTGYAHVSLSYDHYGVVTGRDLESIFIRRLSNADKARNTYIALAIAASVVLVAGLTGLLLLYLRQKKRVAEPESAGIPAAKPHWWMVEGKNEKMDWQWRLSHHMSTPSEGSSRVDRLRKALKIPKAKSAIQPILPIHRQHIPSPTDTLNLPMQTKENVQPIYPAALEGGQRIPAQSPPQIPTVTMTTYDVNKTTKRSPNVPPKAIVAQSHRSTLSRSLARCGTQRPASRRRLSRNSYRHPFLPLKDYDLAIPASDPLLGIGYGSKAHESRVMASNPAGIPSSSLKPPLQARVPIRKPTVLRLLNDSSGRLRVGLPSSPRPVRASPQPAV